MQENIGARVVREERSALRARLSTVCLLGAAFMPVFLIIDVVAARSWFPDLDLTVFGTLRLSMIVWWTTLWWILRRTDSLAEAVADWLIFGPPGLALAGMAAVGGTSSPYIASITLLITARTLLVPGGFARQLPIVGFLLLTYPVMLLAFGPHAGDPLTWLRQPVVLGYLAANLFPLMAIAAVGLVGAELRNRMHRKLVSARSLGRYKLRKELGRGAMGVVHLAWHRDLGRRCVVKLINPEQDGSGALRRRFEREARETSRLVSPHTVRVFDFGVTQEGQLFYVMEYLVGETLDERQARTGVQPAEDVARWLVEACLSLAEAHARHLVHRDIKPANLFLARTADGRQLIKVLDFGIARKLDDRPRRRKGAQPQALDPKLTAVGAVMGTPLYVAPEVLEGLPATHAADQYSLAATGYHLLTGRPVFIASTMDDLLNKTLDDPPESMLTVVPGIQVSPAMDQVLLKALSKDPFRRYPSMEALRLALEPFARPSTNLDIQALQLDDFELQPAEEWAVRTEV